MNYTDFVLTARTELLRFTYVIAKGHQPRLSKRLRANLYHQGVFDMQPMDNLCNGFTALNEDVILIILLIEVLVFWNKCIKLLQ